MRFYGVTLVSVPPDKIETSLRILLSTIINFGADGSDCLIKFGSLATFYVLIDSLSIMYLPEIGVTNFSFAYFSLSLDGS